jgi:hypothetical protein
MMIVWHTRLAHGWRANLKNRPNGSAQLAHQTIGASFGAPTAHDDPFRPISRSAQPGRVLPFFLSRSTARRLGCEASVAAFIHEDMTKMLDTILGKLRPKTDSTEAIRSAIAATADALTAAEAAVAKLRAGRGDALLAGGEQAAKAEAALRAAVDEAERLAALREALDRRLAEAARKEAAAALQAALAEAGKAVAAFDVFREREYPALAQKIAAGLVLEQKARDAIARVTDIHQQMPDEDRPGISIPQIALAPPFHPFGFGRAVHLPSPDGSRPIWPART